MASDGEPDNQDAAFIPNGITEKHIFEGGARLEPTAAGDQPILSEAQAVALAKSSFRADPEVIDAALARYRPIGSEPPATRLVWTVTFDPNTVVTEVYMGAALSERPGLKLGTPQVQYAFAVIDASSGELLVQRSPAVIPVPEHNSSTLDRRRREPLLFRDHG